MLLLRFCLIVTFSLGVISRAEAQQIDYLEIFPRPTPARLAPWVEFMRAPELRAWFDTSRIVGDRSGPIDVTLSFDYGRVMGFVDDSTIKYTRMDWALGLDCLARRLQQRGMILYDSAGTEITRWTLEAPEPWGSVDDHTAKRPLLWACRRLAQLGRQPLANYVPMAPLPPP